SMSGVTVRLVARNNEILGTARTDANGYARFQRGLNQGEGGMAPALLVAEAPSDYAFLDLAAAPFDLTDRGVKGRDPPGPLDAFVYTERGVYRPGEDVHLTALVRDRAGKASSVPLILILTRPDGVEDRRVTLSDLGQGGRVASSKLASSAMTGTWRVKLHTDPKDDPVASLAFLVEDFTPERIDLKLAPAVAALVPEVPAAINVAGRYLYGPPAANLALEGEIVVKPSAQEAEGLAGYRFGLADQKISPVRTALEGLPATGADGTASVPIILPAVPRTARPLEADVLMRLREPGGRTVERKITLPVDLKLARVGIKPLFAASGPGEGETAEFDVLLLDAAGRRVEQTSLRWTLFRLEQNWQWYRRDGQWAYEAIVQTRKAADGAVRTDGTSPARIAAKIDWGRYRLEVAAADKPEAVSSVVFAAGWHADASADSPEVLDIALDRPAYRQGETAKLKIASRQSGKALIAVLGSGLLAQKHVDVPAGGGEVALEVGAGWGAGVYIAAMLYRPMDEGAKRMPARAVGMKWLALDQTDRTLQVALDVPAKAKSGAPLSVPVRVAGLAAGEDAHITVAAVDAGILNLTRYQAPAPENWFLSQRRLRVEIRDFYGRLIDGMRAERGTLRFGGDGPGGMSMQGNPPVEATLALFSGLVKVNGDGTAKVDFALPDFNGTVRLMAVAWSAE
ncbi:MAG: alpha-2-macroglobulin family protein, partial [Hyphomicrobiaceae bacterium]